MPQLDHPYIPNTEQDRRAMLQAIGVPSADDLFNDIPVEYRNSALDLPPMLSEQELRQELAELSSRNADATSHASFLGAGAYNHYLPSIVGTMLSRGEFLTCYTPYQPEVAQGTLQVAFEFQSLVCQLMGMEVSNAGMYDGATALAEAALMACRTTNRHHVQLLDTVSPHYVEVVRAYAEPQGVKVEVVPAANPQVADTSACLAVQSPNFYGYLEDLAALGKVAHDQGALFVVSMDPIAMGMFRPPGAYGADIATGEGQALGVPLSFGGPYVGLFTCQTRFLRQMPGRIVGRATDTKGREGYVLTLQTREQHIRRQRATSNICTSTQLIALAATVYMASLGKQGIREVAELCYHKAHYAAGRIAQLPGFSLPFKGTFFQEFTVQCPIPTAELNRRLVEKGVIGGYDISEQVPNGMLIAVTEVNWKQDIDLLVDSLAEVAK